MITVITEECNEISQEFYDNTMDSIQTCQFKCSCGHCGCLVGHGSYIRSVKTALGKIPLVQHCANNSEYSTCYLHQYCVVVSQQCHRIASFLRLALSQISGTVFHCYLGNAVLVIRRVQCRLCHATHALLPSAIVPYSQISLSDHAAIASSYEKTAPAVEIDGMKVMDANPELSPSQVFYILSLYIRLWRQRLLSENLPLSPAHALTMPCIRLFGRQFMQIKNTRNILFVPPT